MGYGYRAKTPLQKHTPKIYHEEHEDPEETT